MDLKQYIPVGEENAMEVTITVAGGATFAGSAWLESNTSTEASIVIAPGLINAGTKWVVAESAIVALMPSLPSRESSKR